MSRRSPEQLLATEKKVLKFLLHGRTREELREAMGDADNGHIGMALRSLVRQRKVKKKGKTRAMVYTAK